MDRPFLYLAPEIVDKVSQLCYDTKHDGRKDP